MELISTRATSMLPGANGAPPRRALVVEGGAMRGIFATGVLDVFLERGFDPFDLAIGVSAGACVLASHLAGQDGRNRRAYFGLMTRREFIDVRRVLAGRPAVDLDWLWDALALSEPLDVPAIVGCGTEFLVVATSLASGDPVYLRPRLHDLFDALKGSCAIPLLYRRPLTCEGHRVVDGGVSDPVPVEEAYRRGAREIMVVRTRPVGPVKPVDWAGHVGSLFLWREPALAAAMRRTAARYRSAVAFTRRPPAGCKVVVVAPRVPLATKSTGKGMHALARDYQLGREAGRLAIERWRREVDAAGAQAAGG